MHLTDDILEAFLEGGLSRRERVRVVRHLLTQCGECSLRVQRAAERHGKIHLGGRFRKPALEEGEATPYAPALERLQRLGADVRSQLVRERLLAAGQWASLKKHSPARRRAIVGADPAFQTWGLYDRLLDATRESLPGHAQRGIEIASLALAVAEALDPRKYGASRITDFKAAATAVRGNCRRVAEDFEGAKKDLERALALLAEGTGDPLERAVILSLQGSWNVDLGFFEEAERLFHHAVQIYRQIGESRWVGRTLINLATAVGYREPEHAVDILIEAADYLDTTTEPLLELCLRHSLALFLNEAGHTQEAVGVLEDSRDLYKQFPNRVFQLRLGWLEAKINRSLRNLREAEEALEEIAAEFGKRGMPQEALLCSLDWAEAVHAQGDSARTIQICRTLSRALESWHMHKEGLAVMLLFVRALEEGSLQQEAFLHLARYMKKAWYFPQGTSATVH